MLLRRYQATVNDVGACFFMFGLPAVRSSRYLGSSGTSIGSEGEIVGTTHHKLPAENFAFEESSSFELLLCNAAGKA